MRRFLGTAIVAASLVLAGAAQAAVTGDELQGQTVDVTFADGTTNSIFFGSNGQALVTGPDGQTLNANWFVQDQKLCLQASGTQECWAYNAAFAAGAPVAMTSGCDAASQWTARGVNAPMAEPVMMGERG